MGLLLSSLIHQLIERSLQTLSPPDNNFINTDPKYHRSYIYWLALLRRLLEMLSLAVVFAICNEKAFSNLQITPTSMQD